MPSMSRSRTLFPSTDRRLASYGRTYAAASRVAAGSFAISERVSPHSLRRTYASLRYACGDDPVYVAEQGGWADSSFPIKVYAKAVRRRERLSGAHREAFTRPFNGQQWAVEPTSIPQQGLPW